MRTTTSGIGLALALAATAGATLLGCGDEPANLAPGTSASAKPSAAPPPATTPAPAASSPAPSAAASSKPLAPNAIDIPSMGVALEPPAGLTGKAQEAGRDVMITFPNHDVAIAIGAGHGDLPHVKEKTKGEKGFSKWVLEENDKAIAEMDTGKGKEYIGFAVKKLGENLVQGSTFTSSRPTSPNEKAVREALALCDGLRAR